MLYKKIKYKNILTNKITLVKKNIKFFKYINMSNLIKKKETL